MGDIRGDAAPHPATPAEGDLRSRALVTLAALVVYRAGCHLPIPGLNGAEVASLFGAVGSKLAIERISVFSLGVIPLLSALLLAELGKLIFPGFRGWSEANEARRNRVLRLAALALAAIQGLGIALGLEDVANFVAEPGVAFRAGTIMTLVAGTAFLIWLADLVTRHGLGSGFWLILAAPVVAELPGMTADLVDLAEKGSIAPLAVALFAAYVALATAAFVALAKANGGAEFPRGSAGPWPLLLAYASLGWLLAALMVVPSQPWREAVMSVIDQGHPVKLVMLALLVGLFALLYANPHADSHSDPPRDGTRGAMGLGAVAALALIAITLVPELLTSHFSLPLVIDGRWLVIIVAVALGMLTAVSDERARAEAGGAAR
jgi:preprotein translocase subunit SecY